MDFFCYKLLLAKNFKLERINFYDEKYIEILKNFDKKIDVDGLIQTDKLKNIFFISINEEYRGYIWISDITRYRASISIKYKLKKGIKNRLESIDYINEITNFLLKQKYAELIRLEPTSMFQKYTAKKVGFDKRYNSYLGENSYYKIEEFEGRKK